jgi:hypothetical protein
VTTLVPSVLAVLAAVAGAAGHATTATAAAPAQVSVPTFGLDAGLRAALLEIAAFTLGALVVTAATALVYRWYTRDPIQLGLSVLLGAGTVGLYLNTAGLLNSVISGAGRDVFEPGAVLFNVVALAVAVFVSPVGRRIGDRVATDSVAISGAKQVDAEVSRIVRTVGRMTPVELPDEVADMEGYDPVTPEVKEAMAGKTLLFPKRLTVTELRERLVARLADDYGVGHVDVDVESDGTVSYLAVGSRASGLGPTLAAGATAVAVRADPPAAASPGDVVQVWATSPEPTRLATGELRATADDAVTLVVDETDAAAFSADERYRLVTLPAEPQADREFASVLRAAHETMGVVVVGEGSDLVGTTVGSLSVPVVAVRPATGAVEAIPARSRPLSAGDTLYAIGRPDQLRRLEGRAAEVTVVGE